MDCSMPGSAVLHYLNSRLLSRLYYPKAFLVAQLVKNPPAKWETWVQSLGWEDPLEMGTATQSSILAWGKPSHPLLSPSHPVLNLSQHQCLFRWVSTSHQGAKVLEILGKWDQRRWNSKVYFHTTRGGQQSKTKQNNCMKSRKVDYRRNIFFSEVSLGHYSSLFSPNSLLSPPPFFYTISPSPSSASSSSSHLPLSLSLSSFTSSSFFLDFVLWVYIAVKCYWS